MNDRIILDAAMVARQIENLKAVYPELAEDDELLASAIEGETDLYAILERVTDAFLVSLNERQLRSRLRESLRWVALAKWAIEEYVTQERANMLAYWEVQNRWVEIEINRRKALGVMARLHKDLHDDLKRRAM